MCLNHRTASLYELSLLSYRLFAEFFYFLYKTRTTYHAVTFCMVMGTPFPQSESRHHIGSIGASNLFQWRRRP